MENEVIQYFIYKKDGEEQLIRLYGTNMQFFDYDGEWKPVKQNNWNLNDEWHEITPLHANKIINSKYKYYLYEKGATKLVRLVNDIIVQIYDEDKQVWIKTPNGEWVNSILLEGDDDFKPITKEMVDVYITNINSKKMTR